MPDFNKDLSRKPANAVKRRRDEHALKNVVSMRISDDEMAALEKICKNRAKSISDIMREAYKSWQSSQRRLCLDA
jgi:hypothetical protein